MSECVGVVDAYTMADQTVITCALVTGRQWMTVGVEKKDTST